MAISGIFLEKNYKSLTPSYFADEQSLDNGTDISYFSFDNSDFGMESKAAKKQPSQTSFQMEMCNPFVQLIQKRAKYLDSLANLPDDWINGKSVKPDQNAIDSSKQILYSFIPNNRKPLLNDIESQESQFYQLVPKKIIPKIIMGPIPSGGIGLEFHADSKNAMFVSVPNKNGKIEIDVKKDDFYYEYTESKEVSAGNIVNEYRAITEF